MMSKFLDDDKARIDALQKALEAVNHLNDCLNDCYRHDLVIVIGQAPRTGEYIVQEMYHKRTVFPGMKVE